MLPLLTAMWLHNPLSTIMADHFYACTRPVGIGRQPWLYSYYENDLQFNKRDSARGPWPNGPPSAKYAIAIDHTRLCYVFIDRRFSLKREASYKYGHINNNFPQRAKLMHVYTSTDGKYWSDVEPSLCKDYHAICLNWSTNHKIYEMLH